MFAALGLIATAGAQSFPTLVLTPDVAAQTARADFMSRLLVDGSATITGINLSLVSVGTTVSGGSNSFVSSVPYVTCVILQDEVHAVYDPSTTLPDDIAEFASCSDGSTSFLFTLKVRQ